MNTGQSLLSIGALLILSLTVLRVNNKILITDEVLIDSKIGILANSIGVSIIEKASRKYFDAKTVTGPPASVSDLTTSLGPKWDEIPPDSCNDFDDFNGYTQQDTFFGSVVFYSKSEVVYVNPTNPDFKVTGPTWHKKLTVKTYFRQIGEPEGTPSDTFKLSTLYSYWYF
jgi:MSHA pilin protein MshD